MSEEAATETVRKNSAGGGGVTDERRDSISNLRTSVGLIQTMITGEFSFRSLVCVNG